MSNDKFEGIKTARGDLIEPPPPMPPGSGPSKELLELMLELSEQVEANERRIDALERRLNLPRARQRTWGSG